jgi:hypothetical protein
MKQVWLSSRIMGDGYKKKLVNNHKQLKYKKSLNTCHYTKYHLFESIPYMAGTILNQWNTLCNWVYCIMYFLSPSILLYDRHLHLYVFLACVELYNSQRV